MLNHIAKRALDNKIAQGFPVNDFIGDVKRLYKELSELLDADDDTGRSEELADIIIYCCGIASYLDIDIEKAVSDKMSKIEKRVYTKVGDEYFKEEGLA